MNTLERRRIVKNNIVDAVAKAALNESRRERVEAARKLRKALAASGHAALKADTISYPRQVAG
jgi:hypothetical protein